MRPPEPLDAFGLSTQNLQGGMNAEHERNPGQDIDRQRKAVVMFAGLL